MWLLGYDILILQGWDMCHTAAMTNVTDSYIHNALSSLSVKLNKAEIQVLITTCAPHIITLFYTLWA